MGVLSSGSVIRNNPARGNLTEPAYVWMLDRIVSEDLPFCRGLFRRALAAPLENDGVVEIRPWVGTGSFVPLKLLVFPRCTRTRNVSQDV
ncbi:MAG: hypothetical protein ABJF23_16190 [Bryobacteraceae bacterium]